MASPFSGRAGRLAAMWAANQATQGLGQVSTTLSDAQANASQYLTSAYDVGRDVSGTGYVDMLEALNTAYGAAPGYLTDAREQAQRELYEARDHSLGQLTTGRDIGSNYLVDSRNAGLGALYAGQEAGVGAVTDYYGRATGTLEGAAGAYDPLIAEGWKGYGMLSNALGLGGAEGTAAAQEAFTEGPGYQWQVDEATDAAQRAGNRIGAAYGGNTIDAVTRLSSNLANQEYQNWIKNLQPYQGATLAATTGKAAQLDELARMYGQEGTTLANIYGTTGKQASDVWGTSGKYLSDLYSTTGKQMSDVTQGTAQQAAGLDAKTGAALAGLTTDEGRAYADTIGSYAGTLRDLASGYGGAMGNLITGTAGQIAQAQQTANNTVTQAGTQGLLAGQQAAANTWGAIFGGLTAGSKLLGSSSFGSLVGTLFK